MNKPGQYFKRNLVLGASAVAVCVALNTSAMAGEKEFKIAAQPLPRAIAEFSRQSGEVVAASADDLKGKWSKPIEGSMDPRIALNKLVAGTGLQTTAAPNGSLIIQPQSASAADATNVSGSPGAVEKNPTSAAAGPQVGQAAASQGKSSPGLEELIVTAQRRSERLEDVPMSVNLVSSDQMEKAGLLGVLDLGSIVPAVQINFNGLNTMVSVRGVGNNANGSTIENNVALYIDGLYQSDSVAVNMDLPNIESVQVLKGPQGTLYGRNATGGAVLVTTKKPSKVWTGSFAVGYAEYNEKTFSGFLSGPISDQIRFSLAGYSRNDDGYLKFSNPVTGGSSNRPASPTKNQTVQAKIQADVSDNLTATLGYLYALTSDARSNQFTPYYNVSPGVPAPPLRATANPDLKSVDGNPKTLVFGDEISLNLALQTGIGVLTSNSGYTHRNQAGALDVDGTYLPTTRVTFRFDEDTYQTSLNYQITAIEDLNLVVGGSYYYDHRFSDYDTKTFLNNALFSTNYNEIRRKAWQFYVDGTYQLTDTISLTVGTGYSHERSELTHGTRNGVGIQLTGPRTGVATFKKWTPRVALRYEIAPQTNIYASYAQGFKAGFFIQSAIPDPNNPVRQEGINAYEIGVKTVQPNFRAELAGFYYDYKDLQVSALIPDPQCTLPPTQCTIRSVTTNGPSAEIYGIDGQITIVPTDQLSVRLGASWLHTKFVSFPNAVGVNLNPLTGTNLDGQRQNWTGQPLQRAPKFSGNIGIDYNLPTDFGDLLLTVNSKFTTSYVPSNGSVFGTLAGAVLERKQRYTQSGYALVNARIIWTNPAGQLSLEAFVRNLTNHRYWINYTGNARGDYGTYAPPRTFGGIAKYKF